mgnify:CR=1 FL=1
MKLSYLDLMTTDPSYNLAMEQYVFDCLPRDRMYFMLWQNDNAIIVGKYQNTIAEINEEAVRERGICVVRRLSGGGAVYHDMGNLNFTFITDVGESNALDLKLFCEPVVRTLATLGVKAEVNGRNDITIDGKKFSGNSQYIRQGRVMHHGTIMFDSDLSVVSEALRVDPTKIQTKGIRSVRSRVTNVAEHLPEKVTLPEFRRILLENILKENPGEAYPLTQDDLAAVEKLRAERYATWDWNYGFSPACTMLRRRRVDGCGLIEAYITVEHGKIAALTFKGDFFSASEPDELAAHFVGCTPYRAGYEKALGDVDVSRYFAGLQILPASTLPNADAMYYHLKMQQRKNKIPAQLPEGVGTANKTGELDTVENDAAIIYDTAKGIDLVVCFMSQDLTDTGAAQSTIAADARAIYGYYNE